MTVVIANESADGRVDGLIVHLAGAEQRDPRGIVIKRPRERDEIDYGTWIEEATKLNSMRISRGRRRLGRTGFMPFG